MTETAPPTKSTVKPSVAVAGGGLAGLTAALRLAQRGFAVTVYEAKDTLGGNLAARNVNGVFHDVYPHMFCPWYANFWQIFGEILGMDPERARSTHFEAREGVKLQDKNSTTYLELENGTTLESVFANLNSKVESFPDMFLLGFSMLDLAATPFQRSGDDLLERLDVNGFIYSRGYSNEKVAALQNYILMVIWSIQSDVTAAASYQDFIKHTMAFPHPSPFCWMLKGSLFERVIEPFEKKLCGLGCEVRKGARVTSIKVAEDGAPTLTIEAKDGSPSESVKPDYAVLAVPGPELAKLAMAGGPGGRLVDAVPQLSEVRRFWGEAIPVVDIYFKKKLPDVPKEQVALKQSDCDMTMLDISQLWTGYPDLADRTALVVAASNSYALTSDDDKIQGFQLIKTLHDDYLPTFNPGSTWDDPASDIDWKKTCFQSNDENRLFVNDVGSWQWRPVSSYAGLDRVFFAGDFCQTDVDMATVEAAIQSGIGAAQAVQAKDNAAHGSLRGDPIAPAKHEIYSDAVFLALKLALLPWAYMATAWSAVEDAGQSRPLVARSAPMAKAAPQNRYSPLTYSLLLPVAFTLDWWKTVYWLARKLVPEPPGAGRTDDDTTIGLIQWSRSVAEATLEYVQRAPLDGAAKPDLAEALAAFTRQAARTAEAGMGAVTALYDPATYRRFWRGKT